MSRSDDAQTGMRAEMRILVVEDDKDVAGFVAKGLREAGHTVELRIEKPVE